MQWEIDSTRLELSPWWNLVNGLMVQDLLNAQYTYKNNYSLTNNITNNL